MPLGTTALGATETVLPALVTESTKHTQNYTFRPFLSGFALGYQAFLLDSSLGFQALPEILNLSEKLITLRR